MHIAMPLIAEGVRNFLRCVRACLSRKRNLLEEEKLVDCARERWYPVDVGEVFSEQYKVLGKLGWGRTSTVWFCRDLDDHSYKVLKVLIHEHDSTTQEEKAHDAICGLDTDHASGRFVRRLVDEFDVQGPSGYWHHCFVFEPAACSIAKLMNTTGRLPLNAIKTVMRNVLQAIDFLHTRVGLVHTDIKTANVMIELTSQEILENFAQILEQHPQKPRKSCRSGKKTYQSFQVPYHGKGGWGAPILGDLGEARLLPFDSTFAPEVVGPQALRAPEILLGLEWGHRIDIWMAGCMLFDMITDDFLFDAPPGTQEWSDSWHVAQVVGLLGNPPANMCSQSELSFRYFDSGGNWKGYGGWQVPDLSFEQKLRNVDDGERDCAVDFLRSMITWDSEKRKTARELLQHPFLQDHKVDTGCSEGDIARADEIASRQPTV